jgi:transposase
MSDLTRIGIDTSKAVFTLHGIDAANRPVLRINLRRSEMIPFFRKIRPTIVAMEACGSSHNWARQLAALGHTVRLVPAQYAKPYVKRGKNDRNDAEAICEAAGRPGMHFVSAKTLEQQADGMVLKVRDTLVGQRTALINAVRGHAAAFGLIAAKGAAKVDALFLAIEQKPDIPSVARDMFDVFRRQIDDINARIEEVDARLNVSHKANPVSQRLATIPGVGPITALTLAIEIDPAQFESGRHLAAWAGLTPKEHSTGGKQRLGGISRAGNERLRRLLVTGATSVNRAADKPGSRHMTEWLRALLARKPRKLAAMALANKMARISWALMNSGEIYRRDATTAVAKV